MSKNTPVLFKRSVIALTVLSASACSSLPQVSGIDFGGVGDGIAKAGKATANATRNTWNTTVSFLGLGNEEEDQSNQDQRLSDEQLLAVSNDVDRALPTELVPLIKTRESLPPPAAQTATAAGAEPLKKPTKELIHRASLDQGYEDAPDNTEDMLHEVVIGENLWQIAKKTTGDARNWHVLADINDLQPDAAVFPGQKLVIPAKLRFEKSATAISQKAISQNSATASNQEIAFNLNTGETLWEFAKRTTGDATNWQAIANHNNFTEKQSVTVYPGQRIFVPQSLMNAGYDVTESPAPATDDVPPSATAVQAVDTAVAEPIMAAALPDISQELAEIQQPVEVDGVTDTQAEMTRVSLTDQSHAMAILKAHYRAEDNPEPVVATEDPQTVEENTHVPEAIMVSGTYFPKAVYNEADLSSSLLMRVSPGTQLEVSRSMDPWYEVKTDEGLGFVHQRDIN